MYEGLVRVYAEGLCNQPTQLHYIAERPQALGV